MRVWIECSGSLGFEEEREGCQCQRTGKSAGIWECLMELLILGLGDRF